MGDGEALHDVVDPYPPPNTQAAYWPDKNLEQEISQLGHNLNEQNQEEAGSTVEMVLGHAYQFFRSIWPSPGSINIGFIASKQRRRPATALIYRIAHIIATVLSRKA